MKDIIVFSTKTCPFCVELKKELEKNEIPYKEIDVEESPEWYKNMLDRSKQDVVPQTWVGEEIVIGNDIQSIKKLLEN